MDQRRSLVPLVSVNIPPTRISCVAAFLRTTKHRHRLHTAQYLGIMSDNAETSAQTSISVPTSTWQDESEAQQHAEQASMNANLSAGSVNGDANSHPRNASAHLNGDGTLASDAGSLSTGDHGAGSSPAQRTPDASSSAANLAGPSARDLADYGVQQTSSFTVALPAAMVITAELAAAQQTSQDINRLVGLRQQPHPPARVGQPS